MQLRSPAPMSRIRILPVCPPCQFLLTPKGLPPMNASHWSGPLALLAVCGWLAPVSAADPTPDEVRSLVVHPAQVRLIGDDACQLVVTATLADGRLADLTGAVQY